MGHLGDLVILFALSIGILWAANVLTIVTVPMTIETYGAAVVLTFWLRYLFTGARG